jgi:hypothetical protein
MGMARQAGIHFCSDPSLVLTTGRTGARALCGLAAAFTLPVLTSACVSYSYVDANNRRHVVGFVDVTIESPDPKTAQMLPSVVTVSSFGLSAYSSTPRGSGLMVGYAKETTMVLPANSCVDLNEPGLCSRPVRDDPQPIAQGESTK